MPENSQIPSLPMTLRLTVNRQAWLDHVRLTASQHETVLPVVKGNGYGFGRPILFEQAAHLADHVAVGTVYEATDVPPSLTPVVLTPAGTHLPSSLSAHAVLTVGSLDHVAALRSHNDNLPVYISHITAEQIGSLRSQFPNRTFVSRLGTSLWLGDKSMMKLTAEVLDVHAVDGGTAGYRSTALPGSGHIVIVGAGSAHGVSEIVGVGSPFHFAQQRVALVEPPYMHSSMLFVPVGQPVPRVGERVDVQQPLTRVSADTISWE